MFSCCDCFPRRNPRIVWRKRYSCLSQISPLGWRLEVRKETTQAGQTLTTLLTILLIMRVRFSFVLSVFK